MKPKLNPEVKQLGRALRRRWRRAPSPTPTGLHNSAQGCPPSEVLLTKEGEATLGHSATPPNPEWVASHATGAKIDEISHAVRCERYRQEQLLALGKFPFTCSTPDIDPGSKMLVLAEEFGEVARAAYELNYTGSALDAKAQAAHLRTELIQLAAVASAWAESLS